MDRAIPRTGYGRWLLPIVLAAVVASSSKCDVGCEEPNPNDWRVGQTYVNGVA